MSVDFTYASSLVHREFGPEIRQVIEDVLEGDPTTVPSGEDWLDKRISSDNVGNASVEIWRRVSDWIKSVIFDQVFRKGKLHVSYKAPMDGSRAAYYAAIIFVRVLNGVLTDEEKNGKHVRDAIGSGLYDGELPGIILSDARRLCGDLVTDSCQHQTRPGGAKSVIDHLVD